MSDVCYQLSALCVCVCVCVCVSGAVALVHSLFVLLVPHPCRVFLSSCLCRAVEPGGLHGGWCLHGGELGRVGGQRVRVC